MDEKIGTAGEASGGADAGDFMPPFYRDDISAAAREVFGVDYLLPWQRLVVANIMECAARHENGTAPGGAFCADDVENKGRQVVLLPTGAGKSLCFMLPAVMLKRPTLVVYPLIALMSDQLRRMEKCGIQAVLFRGQQTKEEREANFQKLRGGARLILANPEVLQSAELVERLAGFGIIHAAVDEAHCVSEWGDTFRPSYLGLGGVLRRLGIPVVTAFTATASPPVLERMREVLFNGEKPCIMRSSSDRQNIHYSVRYACAKEKAAVRLAMTEARPMVVFCGTRALSEKLARMLREVLPPDEVRFYHAGLTREEKDATEEWFFPHKSAVLCCTCAFGMGVDKGDIRTVVHLDAPPTAEAYVQEAGRGGRDGLPSKAILLWSIADSAKAEGLLPRSREAVMPSFATSGTCRRQVLLDALGAEKAVCGGCDICDATEKGEKPPRHAEDARMAYRAIAMNSGRWSVERAAEELCRRANAREEVPLYEPQDFLDVIGQLCARGALHAAGRRRKRLYLRNYGGRKCYSISSSGLSF